MATYNPALDALEASIIADILDPNNDSLQFALDSGLWKAVSRGLNDAIVALFSHGARITEISIFCAARRGNTVAFQAFLDHGWDINSVDFGQPALRLVVGNEDVVRWFLEHGADPNLKGSIDFSILSTAALKLSTSVLELLISHGAYLDPVALLNAMSPRGKGGIPVMKFLVDKGINLDTISTKRFSRGGTPLHFAVKLNSIEKVKLVLEGGADKTIKHAYGSNYTPAEMAYEMGYMDIFELISSWRTPHQNAS